MNANKSFKITIAALLVFALVSMSFKVQPIAKAYEDFLPKSVYEVTYHFYSKGKEKKIFIKSYQPQSNERQKISKVKQESDNMNFVVKDEDENQRAIWRAKDKSKFHTVKYSFIYRGKAIKFVIDDKLPIVDFHGKIQPKYLQAEEHIEVNDENIQLLAKNLAYNVTNLKTLIKRYYDYVHRMPSAPIRDLTSALTALEQNKASCNGKARLFVALCRAKGIPARLKGGLILEETKKRTSHLWTEVFIGDKWVPFDVLNGHFAYLPSHYLELYTGDHFLITHTPNILFDYTYEMKKASHIPLINITTNDDIMNHPISLLKLSESGIMPKGVLYFLLLLPLGGLLIALFKNVVGLKTFGVFLPVLIAYTFTSTGYFTGVVLLLFIAGMVALISVPFGRWGLLYTPKIVAILTFTVVAIFALINFGLSYDINWLKSLSFFPIIITAIMSERFARAIEEDGHQAAISTMLQTLVATSVCYLVFASVAIQTLLLIFPELILITIAITLLLGKWIGLRLTEYSRFSYVLLKR
jgi:hypothetical protein